MQIQGAVLANSPLPKLPSIHRRPWPHAATSAFASSSPSSYAETSLDQSRGGLPRFYSRNLPSSMGDIVYVKDDEFWHMKRVLRLGVSDRVELFNGAGGVIKGCIQKVDRTGLEFIALEDLQTIAPNSIQWDVFSAFGTLKGGRADWLVEKCTELGARGITPLLTRRSSSIAEKRLDRLRRVSLAATKQCQRLHGMKLNSPIHLVDLLPKICQLGNAFLAVAGGSPLVSTLHSSSMKGGLLIIGPEGDFTEEEVNMMTEAGATSVGLGPLRLRVETATIALLATLMLWSETQDAS